MSSAALAVANPRKFVASQHQARFFDWVANGSGSAILKAVAGSGKSTSIVRSLEFIPETATVLILAFNSAIAKEMKVKIIDFGTEIGRAFRNVEACTFHSRGYRALLRHFGKDAKVEVDGGKVRKILKDRLSETEYEMYGDFVGKLVGFAKGVGVGIPGLAPDTNASWVEIILSQDMWLDDEAATEERAIDIARKALAASTRKAETEKWIDFDDQLYLPLLWNLRMFQHDWVYVDEAQDVSPTRMAFAKKLLRPGGRIVAVGDQMQNIFKFAGSMSNALDEFKARFDCVELPLTVSYRCPRAVGRLAQTLVSYFEVAPGAAEGAILGLPAKKTRSQAGAFDGLTAADAVLCRQTAPLVSLAFALIAEGRGVFVLGKDIGANLANLVKKMKPNGVPSLIERLGAWLDKETEKFLKEDAEAKAEAASDRVACIRSVIDSIPERERTVPAVLAKIESLFADGDGRGLLTLCTMHKAKGREWPQVAIYRPELCPSKAAKSEDAFQQEQHLLYVSYTRAQQTLIFVEGEV
jgi:DNA helicase-2/ATP-dependent DNA helicase PcrA